MRVLILASLLLVATLAPAMPTALGASFTVSAFNFGWTPNALSLALGDSITFTNSTAGTPHTWVRDDATDSCSLPCTRTFSVVATIPYHCGVHPSMKGTIQVGSAVAVAITSPAQDASVSGVVSVSGTAAHPTAAITGVTVRFDDFSPVTATLSGSGASVTWTAQLNSSALSDGGHVITARAQTAAAFALTSIGVNVDNPDFIDLAITQASAPQSAAVTSSVTLSVRNSGNVASGTFIARAEYLYQGSWRLIGERSLSAGAGQTATTTVAWNPPTPLVGKFTIRVVADPAGLVNDTDRANNAAQSLAGWGTNRVDGIDPTDPL